VSDAIERVPLPHLLLGAACCGVAAANLARVHGSGFIGVAAGVASDRARRLVVG
jgi:hypothetical protein